MDNKDLDLIAEKQLKSIEALNKDILEAKLLTLNNLERKYLSDDFYYYDAEIYMNDEIPEGIDLNKAKRVVELEEKVKELTEEYNRITKDYIYR